MKTDSIYSISFYSDELNSIKYDLLKEKAIKIRDFKNEMSEQICNDPQIIVNTNKHGFSSESNTQIEGLVGREIQPAITDVYIKYENKVNSFKQKIQFRIQKEYKIEKYKRKSGKNKKGDTKKAYVQKKSTKLTKICTYIAKYYNPTLIEYLVNEVKINKKDEKTIEFYKDVLYYIDKYGERLLNLCINKQQRTFSKVFEHPIKFKSLTYSAVNNLNSVVEENNNEDSCLTHYIILSGFKNLTESGKLPIPIKYNDKYHKSIEDFNKNQPTYTIQFIKDKVRIILTKMGERNYKNDGDDILGVDVNLKHNLFSCSDKENSTIDFDRDLIKNFIKYQKKIDKKSELLYKKEDSELTTDEKKQKTKLIKRKEKWLRRLDYHFKYLAHELIKYAKDNDYDHLSIEDLLLQDKSHLKSEEFFNIKYSRLVKILHLSNFKNILTTQCSNKDIQLTIVPSEYSSQRCSCCGYVDKNNRLSQEVFKCLECNYETNADYNASQNIKQFAYIEVLYKRFLTKSKSNGWSVPKAGLNKYKIRKVLDDYFEENKNNNNSYDALNI